MRRRAQELLSKLVSTLRTQGLRATGRSIGHFLAYRYRQYRDGALDRRYGTDTGGLVPLSALAIDSPHGPHGVHYEPVTRAFFRRMLATVPIEPGRYTFVDLGCGKGRALLLAAAYPFRRIVGVDFAPELCRIARDNLRRYLAHTGKPDRFEVHCQDAASFQFPAGPLALYLYNPFGAPVLEKVLANLQASLAEHPRPLLVFYRTPVCAALLDRQPYLMLLRATPDFRVYGSCDAQRQ